MANEFEEDTVDPEVILQLWMRRWGPLSSDLVVRFLNRPELDELTEYPMWVVNEAIHCEQKLARAVAYADRTMDQLAGEMEIEYSEWCTKCGHTIDRSERIVKIPIGIRHRGCDPW